MKPCHKLLGEIGVIILYFLIAFWAAWPAASMVVGLTCMYVCTIVFQYIERKRIHGELEKLKEFLDLWQKKEQGC